jgi:NADH-quinone oxidoreductase subunit E
MLEIASQMILCLLLAALLGAIIGYLFGKSTCTGDDCSQSVDTHVTNDTHTTSAEAHGIAAVAAPVANADASDDTKAEGTSPKLLSGPRNGEKDNLTRIKGIGVKIEETLNGIGIYHFDQIASWNKENVSWVDANVAFPGRVKREQWVEQAKALALGEE